MTAHWGRNPHGVGVYCDICEEVLLVAGVTENLDTAETITITHILEVHPEDFEHKSELTLEQQQTLLDFDRRFRYLCVLLDPQGVEDAHETVGI